jgi:hypothetical protein
MRQQINFYNAEFSTGPQIFGAATLLIGCGVILLAMALSYVFALRQQSSITSELQIVRNQEKAAIERLQNLRPTITAVGGDQNWSERLEEATRSLREKQLVLSLVQGSTLGATQGFSGHLISLARRDTDALWLTHIRLSGLGDKTQLEGKALRAELVPAYLQSLAEEPPFATQRFHQLQIEGSEDPIDGIVTFSMNSEAGLLADAAD